MSTPDASPVSRPFARHSPIFILILFTAVIFGCGDSPGPESAALLAPSAGTPDPPSNALPPEGTVVLELDHTVDGSPLVLDQLIYTNAAGNNYSVVLLEYVISNLALLPEGGTAGHTVTSPEPRYRSHADPATRDVVLENVPAGHYSQLRFTFGLPAEQNVTGAFPELDLLGMAWPQQLGGGYHYMRNEGLTGATPGAFATHTGPTQGNDYSIDFDLGVELSVADAGTTYVTLEMDVNEWYANPNVYDFNDYGPILGNLTAQQILQANGADVFSVAPTR